MGLSSGEREAGFTVGFVADLIIWSIKDCLVESTFWPSWGPKSCCDNVMLSWRESRGEEERVTTPELRRKRLSSSTRIRLVFWALIRSVSSSLLRFSRASTSSLFLSRED